MTKPRQTELIKIDKNMPDHYFESIRIQRGFKFIAGVDEAGRGPLAGPVVAAAVILPNGHLIDRLNDSKKLSPALREDLFESINAEAVSVGIGMSEPKEVDDINILQATLKAMRKAVMGLDPKPDFLLVDGINTVPIDILQETIKKGDSLSMSIAAASVIAKVTRDRIMLDMHEKYPEYNFISNKGYGTKDHIEALKQHGPSPIHRLTFRQVTHRVGAQHAAPLEK